jgi:hypothetical protein
MHLSRVVLFCGVTKGRRFLQIGSSLGHSRKIICSKYLHLQLLQELSVMFSKNGHSLASSNGTESIPAERLLGNRLIMGELEYDIRISWENLSCAGRPCACLRPTTDS